MKNNLYPASLMVIVATIASLSESLHAASLTITSMADTALMEDFPNNNQGANSSIELGIPGNSTKMRDLFKFDVSSIPAGSTVSSVSVKFTVTFSHDGTAHIGNLHKLLANWGEGTGSGLPNATPVATTGAACWNSRQFGQNAWTTAGGGSGTDYASAISGTGSLVSSGASTFASTATLVSDVQAWVNSPSSNFGWILMYSSETGGSNAKRLATREDTTVANRPSITVTYTTAAPTPTIAITNPASGAIFAAPASVTIGASASVNGGTVTNVTFQTNGVSVGSATVAPFSITLNNLRVSSYALTAVATAGGVSATSAVVNISVVPPPSVTITNPVGDTVFAAPASVHIGASASVVMGSVTNVTFFQGAVLLGSIKSSPFTITASNLVAGAYSLTAVATAAGLSTTSSVVNISVVSPVAVTNSLPKIVNNQFIFGYNADIGLSYVIQNATDITNWVSIATNVATGSPVMVTNAINPSGAAFYRVGRLPNP
ncbi:MAG: Chitinase [Verrucomicrobiales bacterium]|nr:Chitinase [Verrucomicrobiales bacterium]